MLSDFDVRATVPYRRMLDLDRIYYLQDCN